MFIDEVEITIQGGDGGDGKIAFFPNQKGPSGGNGGKGGNVYFIATTNISDLKTFTKSAFYKADNGSSGGLNRRNGISGKDLYLKVPLNTTIIDMQTNKEITLSNTDIKVLICEGGINGFGNSSFKTSTNRTPREATPGKKGQIKIIKLILKLIADFGIIGLPNAGKSSLLNVLTKANVKTAAYPFTTLEPNLGVFNGKIIADIPGLIEGASTGKGLGIRFLKHIEKVSLLLHCISAESETTEKDYDTVIGEISKYNKEILEKKTVILLTKKDLVTPDVIENKIRILKNLNSKVLPVSIYDPRSLQSVRQMLSA